MTRDQLKEMQKKLGAAILGWKDELACVESQEVPARLRQEVQDVTAELTKAVWGEAVPTVKGKPNTIDWIGLMACNLSEVVRLYLTFHAPGRLELVTLLLSEDAPDLVLTLDGQPHSVDFFLDFRNGASNLSEPIRAAHKECALCHGETWGEYRICVPGIPLCDIGASLCRAVQEKLSSGERPLGAYCGRGACADSFRVDVPVEFEIQADPSQ